MYRANLGQLLSLGLLCVVLVVVGTAIVSAAVTLNASTQYAGTDGDSQVISSQVQFSPNDARITDVTIQIRETDQGFVDLDSFERSVSPGGADINITYVGDGHFTVDEIEPNEEITVRFDAYPRRIKEESLDVATVEVAYVQQGQSLSASRTISADLSNSSWFRLQQSQNQVQQMQLAFYGGIAAIVVLIAILAVMGYRRISKSGGTGGGGGSGGDVFE
jgi:hypothetical protein